jgi:hypothetical protein
MKLWGERIERRLCVIDQSKSYKKLKWEAQEVQSSSLVDLRGRDIIKEVMDEQIVTQVEG